MAERIHKAIVAVMREIGAIGREGRNEKQNYNYRKIEDVYNRVQPLLSKHGIFSAPQVIETKQETGKSKTGGMLIYITLTVKYQFFADDGSHVDVVVSGQGMDSGDKASVKAMTSCHKTALCQLFNIPYQVLDVEKFSPEWAAAYNEKISLRNVGDLKKEWYATIDADGKDKTELGKLFALWVTKETGHEFDVSDPRHWTRDDWLTCTEVLATDEKGESSEKGNTGS